MRYTLEPHLIQSLSFQPDPAKPLITVSFRELCERLAPPPIKESQKILLSAKVGDFIGLRRVAGSLQTFLVEMDAGDGTRLEWLLEKQPAFIKECALVYRVRGIERQGGVLLKKPLATSQS